MADAPTVNFLHNPLSPDVFSDGPSGFHVSEGIVRITLESFRVNHSATPGPIDRVVVGRLVMPLPAAERLARGLLEFIETQKANAGAPSNVTIQ